MGNCITGKQNKDQLNSNKCNNKCSMNEFEQRVYPLIDNLKLDKYQKSILKKRFVKLVIQYELASKNVDFKYNSCRIIISIGSMILPTLQTIQNNENVSDWKNEIFWAAIATSLGVMISNNLISMFALDRRYIMYSITAEKLKSMGWKYFELSDMFSKKNHRENWIMFWNEVEKIKKLQMIAEFTDHDDKPDNNKDDDDKIDKKEIEYYDSDSSDSSDNTNNMNEKNKKEIKNEKEKNEIELKEVLIDKDIKSNVINKGDLLKKHLNEETLHNIQTEVLDNINIEDIGNNIKDNLDLKNN